MKKRTKGLITLAIAAFSTIVLAQSFTTFPYVRVQNQLDLQGTVTANGSTGTSGQILTSQGSSDVIWQDAPVTVSGANPTATVGTTAVNGSANTYLRSDGAPAINQGMSPQWTGLHKWLGTSTRMMAGSANFNTRTVGATSAMIQVEGTGNATSSMSIVRNNASSGGGILTLGHSRSNAVNGTDIVFINEALGTLDFAGADGVDLESRGGSIVLAVDGTPGVGDMPGRLQFNTTADGAEAPTERMRINSSGAIGLSGANFGTTSQAIVSNGSSSAPTWQTVCISGATCLFGDGTVGAPSMAFSSETDTGIYKFAANTIGVSAAGQAVANWTEFGLNMTGSGAFLDFMTVNPTAYIEWKDDTGATIRSRVGEVAGTMFVQKLTTGGLQLQTSSGTISLTPGGGGSNIVSLAGPTQFTSTMRGAAGTAGAPAFSFTSDTDDGIFSSGANQVAIATGGTQRFTINGTGEIGLGSGNSVGTAGQVLTSGGSSATPTWTTPIAVSSGSFTVNYDDACTTTPAATFKYLKIGDMVTLSWNSPGSCTSDSVNFLGTAADVPAALRPTTTQFSMALKTINNGVIADAVLSIGSSGTVTVYFCPGAGGSPLSGAACAFNSWTNSGSKRTPLAGTMTYSVGH